MKKVYLLLIISTMAVGCGNNQRSTNSSMNEEEFQKYDSVKHEEGMIAIETTFEPTLELTDEIKNATLEDLIIQGKGKLSKADQERQDAYMKKFREDMRKEGLSDSQIKNSEWIGLVASYRQPQSSIESARDYELKYVPATSNLAKVYYLEDMGKFIEHNKDYYNAIANKVQDGEQQNPKQKNWDKYL
jgi:hypothetical protein